MATDSLANDQAQVVFVETLTGDAYTLIENLTKVCAARRLIDDVGFVDYEDIKACRHSLIKLERSLRLELRALIKNPATYYASDRLNKLIREEIKTKDTVDLSFLKKNNF